MPKNTQGYKIHKYERVRNAVFKWIVSEPSITDSKISERLRDELNFKASQPSVASWRENYFPEMFKAYEGKLEDMATDVTVKIDTKLDSLEKLNAYITEFEKRRELLAMIMPSYSVDPNNTSGVRYVSANEQALEERYYNTAKFVIDLLKERDKLIGGWSPYDVATDTAQQVVKMVALYLKVDTETEEYKSFKEALVQFDASLRERYNVKK
jgi:hypothetical protein